MNIFHSSFRDPSGKVFCLGDKIIRTVNACYSEDWHCAVDSGLLDLAQKNRWIPEFHESTISVEGAIFSLEVEKIPFISYPYEWCFSQLQDAALHTLKLHVAALDKKMVLKDASAYNMQFIGTKPIFIDLLSFEKYKEGQAWQAYRQFCMHFLAPLALLRYFGPWCGTLSKLRTDGISLGHAAKILPWHARLNFDLLLHIFIHAGMESRHSDARKSSEKARSVHLTQKKLHNFALSLTNLIAKLTLRENVSQWGNYYTDTNYSETAFTDKQCHVGRIAQSASKNGKGVAVDLGANTGTFTALLSPYYEYVLAPDVDPLAVEYHYTTLKKNGPSNIFPFILDLSNPSPALGWACKERDSFQSRCKAQFITALALIHHLFLTEGIPFTQVAAFLHGLLGEGGELLIEFVPLEDSQVQRMIAARIDSLEHYTLENMEVAFAPYFEKIEHVPMRESARILLHFHKKIGDIR